MEQAHPSPLRAFQRLIPRPFNSVRQEIARLQAQVDALAKYRARHKEALVSLEHVVALAKELGRKQASRLDTLEQMISHVEKRIDGRLVGYGEKLQNQVLQASENTKRSSSLALSLKSTVRNLSRSHFSSHFAKFELPRPSKKIEKFCLDAGLKLIDVGGRGLPPRLLRPLMPYSDAVLFEPEENEAQVLEASDNQLGWRSVRVLREAVGTHNRQASLHVTGKPGLSSIHRPNSEAVLRYGSENEWQVKESSPVKLKGLKQLIDQYQLSSIAGIKLDTQGSELEILQSAESSFLSEVVFVHVEMMVREFYHGQGEFHALDKILAESGFRPVDFKRAKLRHRTEPRVTYSKGELGWVHALYFKDDFEKLSFQQAHQLVAVCLLTEYFDRAVSLLLHPRFRPTFETNYGVEFVDEVFAYSEKAWEHISEFLDNDKKALLVSDSYHDRMLER